MDGPQEVASGLVVARGNGSVLFQARKEVLNQMARLVQVTVTFARLLVRPSRRNHRKRLANAS